MGYAALWGRLEGLQEPTAGRGAQKSWASLSEQTKRGYRGRMRSAYGIGNTGWTGRRYRSPEVAAKAEREFREFYQTADDLRFLRRHGSSEKSRVNPGQFRLVGDGSGSGAVPAFVTTWSVRNKR